MLGSVSDNGEEDEGDKFLIDISGFDEPFDRTDL